MRPTRVEDYLTAIAQLCEAERLPRASTGAIAGRLGVAKGTASSALKQLADEGLVERLAYEGVTLTERGRERAERAARRRGALAEFLQQTLALGPDEAAEEAARWEPVASERLVERIAAERSPRLTDGSVDS